MKRKKIYSGRLLSLYKSRLRLPNNFCADLEIVEHPGAVLIVPFLRARSLVLIRQFRPVIGRFIWEFPAGTLEKRERPKSCAQRELREETGFRADALEKCGIIYPVPGYSTEKIHIYKATKLTKVAQQSEPDEIIGIHIMSISAVRVLLSKGALLDAKTIAALALCGLV